MEIGGIMGSGPRIERYGYDEYDGSWSDVEAPRRRKCKRAPRRHREPDKKSKKSKWPLVACLFCCSIIIGAVIIILLIMGMSGDGNRQPVCGQQGYRQPVYVQQGYQQTPYNQGYQQTPYDPRGPPPPYTPPPAQQKETPSPGAPATPSQAEATSGAKAKPAENVPTMTYSQVIQRITVCKKIKKEVSTDFQKLAKNRSWLKGAAKAMFSKFGAISEATALDPFAKKMLVELKCKHIWGRKLAWGKRGKEIQGKASDLMKWGSSNKMDVNKYEVYVRGWLLLIALPQQDQVKRGPELQKLHFDTLDAGKPFDYNRLEG